MSVRFPLIPTRSDQFNAVHSIDHCIDENVATRNRDKRIIDFCYDCDDFVTRISNTQPTGTICHGNHFE